MLEIVDYIIFSNKPFCSLGGLVSWYQWVVNVISAVVLIY